MSILSPSKARRLFWLGRYTQRALLIPEYAFPVFDRALEPEGKEAYEKFCESVGCPAPETWDFLRLFLLDSTQPFSMSFSLKLAYENGFVLRDLLDNDVFSFLRMAFTGLEELKVPAYLAVKSVTDTLYAFWGALEESLPAKAEALCRWGRFTEVMDYLLRFGTMRGREEALLKLEGCWRTLDLAGPLDKSWSEGSDEERLDLLGNYFDLSYGTS